MPKPMGFPPESRSTIFAVDIATLTPELLRRTPGHVTYKANSCFPHEYSAYAINQWATVSTLASCPEKGLVSGFDVFFWNTGEEDSTIGGASKACKLIHVIPS